jgi:hypothetical protein
MAKVLTPRERLILIRKENKLFNRGEISQTAKIFVTTAYKDGLIRVGDYYYFDQENPLKALYYYLESGYRKRIDEISERMAAVIKKWLRDQGGEQPTDGKPGEKSGSPPPRGKSHEER